MPISRPSISPCSSTMVWGSIAGEIQAGTITTERRSSANLDEGYPMYVLPVADFLAMSEWRPHQVLKAARSNLLAKQGKPPAPA